MGKGLGSLAAFAISFALTFNRLPEAYEKIVAWLAPVLGKILRVTFSSLYLLFGDPLTDHYFLITWVAAAFIGGLLAKKMSSGIIATVSAYLYNFPLLVFCGFNLFESFESIGGFETLPPFPPGTSIADFLTAPLIGEIITALMGGMLSGGGSVDLNVITSLVTSIILPKLVKNLILVAIFGAIGGYIRSKLTSEE